MTRPLTVTVDARVVFDEVRRGIAKATVETYRALAAARPDWRFLMLHRTAGADDPFADVSNVTAERVDMPGDRFGLWPAVRLPAANLARRPDLFHAPAGPAPRFPLAPLAVTVHDLIPLDTRPADADVVRWGASVRRAARQARVILTPSDHAKGRIVHHFAVPPERIAVVRWGPTSAPSEAPTAEAIEGVRRRYGVPPGRGSVLHFGMADPRKNTALTLDAWATVPAAVRAGFVLVIVGVQGPALDRFREQAERLGVAESVRVHGYALEDDVRNLLAGAAVLCYPTTYEGFGLPVLDAFAAGVPVLAGDRTSVPEVTGDAAVLVDPTDANAVAIGLTRLLADPGLRADLAARGRERLRSFTWARAAERVAAAFEAAACRRPGGRTDAGRG